MALRIVSPEDVETRLTTLRTRHKHARDIMRRLDDWRNMLKERLVDVIWKDVPENAKRWTEPSSYIASITDACVAMLASERPTVTTQPKRAELFSSQDVADFSEEVGIAVFDTLNENRSTTIQMQVAEYAIGRANLVAKITSLGPDERGEQREYNDLVLPDDLGLPFGLDSEPVQEFTITEEGEFPILYQLIDPLDCYWTLGKDGRVIEFIHCYMATWDVLCDEFPEVYDHPEFGQYAGDILYADTEVEVIDYWNEDINCILIDSQWFKKPTEYDLPGGIPVIVEEINVREVPITQNGKRTMRMGRPFCEYLLDLAATESWCMSLGASYIEMMPFATMFLEGVDINDPSTALVMGRKDSDGKSVLNLEVDNSPGGKLIPLPRGTKLSYQQPPPMVPILQEMKQWASQSMQMLTFSLGILSGDVQGPPSGYAYWQMKQVPMARLGPYEIGANRFLSRCLKRIIDIIVADWDRADYPLILSRMTGQKGEQQSLIPVTREQFASVGTVQVRLKVSLPTNREQEQASVIAEYNAGLLSPTKAIEELGRVQNARAEWEAATAQRWTLNDPMQQARIAAAYFDKQGYPALQPKPQPVAPGMPGAPPDPNAPPLPSPIPGGPPQGPPPGMGVDPMMAQMMGGGGMPMPPLDPTMLPGGD